VLRIYATSISQAKRDSFPCEAKIAASRAKQRAGAKLHTFTNPIAPSSLGACMEFRTHFPDFAQVNSRTYKENTFQLPNSRLAVVFVRKTPKFFLEFLGPKMQVLEMQISVVCSCDCTVFYASIRCLHSMRFIASSLCLA